MIWNPERECMKREELEKIQVERLKFVVERLYERLPFYREKLDKAGVKPHQIKSLKDLRFLPFTTKEELRQGYPYGLFAAPLDQIVEFHMSSGTTGKPVVGGYTRGDIDVWSEVMARALSSAGCTSRDIVQNAYGYGLFTGGLGVHYGAQKIGAKIIPISGGQTKRQIMIMKDFGSTVLTCTPSYALHIAEVAEEMGEDPVKLPVKIGILGAECWSESMREEIEKRLGIRAFDIYGLTEIIGPGVAQECEERAGLHIYEDHFLPEIVDPDTLEPLPEGEEGELVITTLTREGTPLLRYRTRDISSITYEPCGCGRTIARISKIKGRTDDMIIIRGVNVFPSQIENVLMRVEETEPHYRLVLERKRGLDDLTVEVETNPEIFFDEVKKLEEIERKIAKEIEEEIGLRVNVKLVEPKSIERSAGKAKRLIDKRALK
ncbi:MAG TPA: phenylacetate--CoA ligase family protein [Candidatus Aerophobetes bacterium]|uniref:Phenylacetate-coenzyme A ligase n=1 Tax=Aerophobetes bacterium TaxID=2030807 RepID=A0A7V5HZR5_UNCAE|nr:phenylacetate--CoA ligase family protein [Candidatus Aerophobetes bacterium]